MISNTPLIHAFFHTKLLAAGYSSYINWNPATSTQHHWLISGNSGSGKSTHLMLLLAKIAKYLPDARLYLLDFKGSDDLKYLREVPDARYYVHQSCIDGLKAFYAEVESRLRDNPDRTPLIAVFDEYASFSSYVNATDKKLAAQCQTWVLNTLLMSRSIGGYFWLCTQRPDQSIMPGGGARDQFGVRVWWGRFSSTEAQQMLFGDLYKQIPPDYFGAVGKGIAYMDGQGIMEVTAPRITNITAVQKQIIKIVTR